MARPKETAPVRRKNKKTLTWTPPDSYAILKQIAKVPLLITSPTIGEEIKEELEQRDRASRELAEFYRGNSQELKTPIRITHRPTEIAAD
jgi:hypothetical protein